SIQQCPWSLIVFSNLSNISVRRIERMLLFSTLALFYYAVVIVPVALGLYFWTRRHGGRRFHRGDAPNEYHEPDRAQSHSWTCPCDEDRGEYRHLALSLIVVVCSFYALIFGATVAELPWCAALVPLCTLVAI